MRRDEPCGGTNHMETFEAAAVLDGDAREMAARIYRRYQEAEHNEGRASRDAGDGPIC
jgi:hypothetical protein